MPQRCSPGDRTLKCAYLLFYRQCRQSKRGEDVYVVYSLIHLICRHYNYYDYYNDDDYNNSENTNNNNINK